MTPESNNPIVCVMVKQADNGALIAETLKRVVRETKFGFYEVETVNTSDALFEMLRSRQVLALVLDDFQPVQDGLSIVKQVKDEATSIHTVLLSDIPIGLGESQDDVDTYITGPLNLSKIEKAVSKVLNAHVHERLQIPSDDIEEKNDQLSSVIRGVIGLFPAGSIITEVFNEYIPNYRRVKYERLQEILAAKLASIDETLLKTGLYNPRFLDLLQEAAFQSARATTEQRLERIASVLKNSLTDEEANFVTHETILSLLGEINDVEVLLLQYHGMRGSPAEQRQFYEAHLNVLRSPVAVAGSPQPVVDQAVMHRNYREHLVQLGLLKKTFQKPRKGELPEFDDDTGMVKAKGHAITGLGRLLLRYIEQSEELAGDDVPQE